MILGRLLRTTRQVALSATALVGALCALGLAGALLFGIHPLMFRSGSMSPTINTGDLAFAQAVSAASLRRGDIASVVEPDGTRVTHRVVSNTKVGALSQVTMKGDGNKVVDPQVYDVRSAERVMLVIPRAGYVVNWFAQSPGSFVLAAYLAMMCVLILRRDRGPSDAAPSDPAPTSEPASTSPTPARDSASAEPADIEEAGRSGRRRRGRVWAVAASALLVAIATGWGQSTWAYWTRPATVIGTTFTAASAWGAPTAAPVVTCGATGKKSVTINWTTVSGATSYDLYYPNGTTVGQSGATGTTVTLTTVNLSGTFTVRAKNSSGSGPASNAATFNVGNGNGSGTCSA